MTFRSAVLVYAFLLLEEGAHGWLTRTPSAVDIPSRSHNRIHHSVALTRLQNDKLDRDINERSIQKAQGQGGGEMAAGALLGGLLLGPFGMLFGANIGANIGSKNAFSKARKEEMERLGISQDMLDAAQEIGVALQQSTEGLEATRNSLQTQQSLARSFDRESEELYTKAKAMLTSGDEEGARSILLKRTNVQEKLKKVLVLCGEEKRRLEQMESNVDALKQRALEIESLLNRTVGAKARQDSFMDFSLESQDPLLQKFKDMGID